MWQTTNVWYKQGRAEMALRTKIFAYKCTNEPPSFLVDLYNIRCWLNIVWTSMLYWSSSWNVPYDQKDLGNINIWTYSEYASQNYRCFGHLRPQWATRPSWLSRPFAKVAVIIVAVAVGVASYTSISQQNIFTGICALRFQSFTVTSLHLCSCHWYENHSWSTLAIYTYNCVIWSVWKEHQNN